MQYHCVQCNQVFTPDPSEDKPRCPKCLRQHGLRAVEAAPARPRATTRSWLSWVAAIVVLGGGAGGYFAYKQLHSHKPGQVPLEPIDAEVLRADVQALTGKNPGELVQLLAADAQVSAFAKHAVGAETSPEGKAKAVCAALAERKQKQAFVMWPRVEAREDAPLTASATVKAIEKDGARKQLYPLEAAALAVAALRSVDVPALIAEVYRFPNERTVLDPSGRLGYHAVVLPKQEGVPERVFDAFAGRETHPAPGDYKVLNDAQAVGAAFALRAVSQLDRGGDTSAGIADSEIAVKLSPSSPSVRSVRGALLLATGGLEAGTHELDAALQLRSDASRRNNLATLGLMSSNPDAAAKEVATALAEAPDYALARVTLATVHLMRGEPDLARVELEKAERLEPDLAVLPQIWAQFYASTNEPDRALAKAQEAVRRRPKDTQARLVLARIDRASGRYDDMRLQAREIMARVPGDQQPRMRELLRGLLGPTAFEDAEPDAADPDKAQAAQAASDALSATSPGHDDNNARGPQLQPGSDSKSLQLQPGGGSRFQLGGGGDTKLKLKLNE